MSDIETPYTLDRRDARLDSVERLLHTEIIAIRDEVRSMSADLVVLKENLRGLSLRIAHLTARLDRPRG
jgi:hypothetical protein